MLGLAWVLAFATDRDADPVALARSVIVTFVLAIAIAIGALLLVRDTPVAGAIAALVVIGLLKATTAAIGLLIILAVTLLLVEQRWESRGRLHLPWDRIHVYLTALAAVTLVIGIAAYGLDLAGRREPTIEPAWTASTAIPAQRPNIYIVIADGHGRADVLRDALGYDDSAFINDLGQLGFSVAAASHANYLFTHLSLPSFFSGEHLGDLGVDMSRPPDNSLLSSATRQSPSFAALRRLGYRIIGIPSGFDHLSERGADVDLDTGQLSELEYRLLESTAVGAWLNDQLDQAWLVAAHDRTLDSLDRLASVATAGSAAPMAVVVHLPTPHPPYAMDADCRQLALADTFVEHGSRIGAADAASVAVAAGQVRCVDRLLESTLPIVVGADPNAVVIVMSDHGPDERLDWQAPGPPGLADRMANLFAARTPGHEHLFPDDVSLVNVLPILFNAYFGMHLPMHADSVYAAGSASDPALVKIPGT